MSVKHRAPCLLRAQRSQPTDYPGDKIVEYFRHMAIEEIAHPLQTGTCATAQTVVNGLIASGIALTPESGHGPTRACGETAVQFMNHRRLGVGDDGTGYLFIRLRCKLLPVNEHPLLLIGRKGEQTAHLVDSKCDFHSLTIRL